MIAPPPIPEDLDAALAYILALLDHTATVQTVSHNGQWFNAKVYDPSHHMHLEPTLARLADAGRIAWFNAREPIHFFQLA